MLVITTLLIIEMGDAESICSKMKNLFGVTLRNKMDIVCINQNTSLANISYLRE